MVGGGGGVVDSFDVMVGLRDFARDSLDFRGDFLSSAEGFLADLWVSILGPFLISDMMFSNSLGVSLVFFGGEP